MKLIVAGSRNIIDYVAIRKRIYYYIKTLELDVTEIVSGTAAGPDKIGESYALIANLPCKMMPADWNKYGKAAGPVRNKEMAEYGDMAMIFWDGESRGTKNMIENMSKLGKPCLVEIVK